MDQDKNKMLGRGQTLQRVMAQSAATQSIAEGQNVYQMRMPNYTNEKIMEFLNTMSQPNEMGDPAQNLPARNLALPLKVEESEACTSFKSEKQGKNTEPSTSTEASVMQRDHYTPMPNTSTDQFTFKEEDFPPL